MHHNNNVTIARVNSNQACAACKYQRRKCPPDCILAPYFPHDRQRQFLNAHKLFGVSNITKIIRHLEQPKKDAAMRTIIFQSDVRANDPVGGCYRIINHLQDEIDITYRQLDCVLRQIAFLKTYVDEPPVQQQIHQLAADVDVDHVDPSDSYPPNISNYDIFCADPAFDSNEHHQFNHIINDNNNNIAFHQLPQHHDQDISLQELPDSWSMQGSLSPHVPLDNNNNNNNHHHHHNNNQLPSPPPGEFNDFKGLDFSAPNQPHDISFDYDTKIEQVGDGNFTEIKAKLEDEVPFTDPQEFKDTAHLLTPGK